VKLEHGKKSDGVRAHHEKERLGERSP